MAEKSSLELPHFDADFRIPIDRVKNGDKRLHPGGPGVRDSEHNEFKVGHFLMVGRTYIGP